MYLLRKSPTYRTSGVVLKKKELSKEKISHELVPQHILLTDEQKQAVLKKFGVGENQLPRILDTDPALRGIDANPGDLIQIKRKDLSGEYNHYRLVTTDD